MLRKDERLKSGGVTSSKGRTRERGSGVTAGAGWAGAGGRGSARVACVGDQTQDQCDLPHSNGLEVQVTGTVCNRTGTFQREHASQR